MLKKEGYDVFGITMDLLTPPYRPEHSSVADAAKVADKLGIPHCFLDLREKFAREVVDYFADSYLHGLTPSPCIMCNRHIKLGALADKARSLGADVIVTGHYADIRLTSRGVELHRAEDLRRDQSYFLFAVDKHTLQMLRCPLASYTKAQTRAIARDAGLEVSQKPDSQDICFVADGNYASLINQLRPEAKPAPGDIVDTAGRVLGRHNGIIRYTVGQRRGLGIGGSGGVLYVLKIDAGNNRIIVGSKEELLCRSLRIKDVNWLGEEQRRQAELTVKLRSRRQPFLQRLSFLRTAGPKSRCTKSFTASRPVRAVVFMTAAEFWAAASSRHFSLRFLIQNDTGIRTLKNIGINVFRFPARILIHFRGSRKIKVHKVKIAYVAANKVDR